MVPRVRNVLSLMPVSSVYTKNEEKRKSEPPVATRVSMEEKSPEFSQVGAQLQLVNQLMHEVRNELSPPLEYMVNQQQILENPTLSAEEKINLLRKEESSSRHANSLLEIDRMLEGRSLVYRLAMGLYHPSEKSLDLRDLLADTIAKVRTLKPNEFNIVLNVPDGLGAFLDPTAIRYAIESLIAHAIFHDATEVELDYLPETSAIRFRCNGSAIHVQDRSHVLEDASLFGASRGADFRLASSQFILDKSGCGLRLLYWDQHVGTNAIIQLPVNKIFKAQPPISPPPHAPIPHQEAFLSTSSTSTISTMRRYSHSDALSLDSIDFKDGMTPAPYTPQTLHASLENIDINSSNETLSHFSSASPPRPSSNQPTRRFRRFVSSSSSSFRMSSASLISESPKKLKQLLVVILDDSRAIRFQIARLWKKLCADLEIELVLHQYESYSNIKSNFFQDLGDLTTLEKNNSALFISIDHNLGNPDHTGAHVISWLQDDLRMKNAQADSKLITLISLTGDETAADLHLDLGCDFAWRKPPIYQPDQHRVAVEKRILSAGFVPPKLSLDVVPP